MLSGVVRRRKFQQTR